MILLEAHIKSSFASHFGAPGKPSPATSVIPVNLASNSGAPVNLASIFVAPASNLGTPWSALASNFAKTL